MAPPLPEMEGSPPVMPTPAVPRTVACDRPPNQRAAFTKFYPNGLPVVYKMLQTPGARGVAQTYLEDNLPVGFYTNPKPNARAIFSTINGENEFRDMQHLLPQRRVHLWTKDDIQSVCNSVRKIFWSHMKEMSKPACWDDLWTYFDASDLYHYGAMNLWNMLNTLYDENRIIFMDVAKEIALHVGQWADAWISGEANKAKLMQWDGSQGPLLPILTEEDWRSLGNVSDDTLPIIANALKHRRALLLAPDNTSEQQKPNDLLSSCQNNGLENWLAGETVYQPNGLPSPPHAASHPCSPTSKNAPAPVLMHNGNHYYHYAETRTQSQPNQIRHPGEALQASQQSVTAAGAGPEVNTTRPVIANGSNRAASRNASGHFVHAQGPQNTTFKSTPEKSNKTKQPPPAFNLILPPRLPPTDPRASAPSADNNVGPRTLNMPEEYEHFAPTDTNKNQEYPRPPRGDSKSMGTKSLPASVVMGYSQLAINSRGTSDDSQLLDREPAPVRLAKEHNTTAVHGLAAAPMIHRRDEVHRRPKPSHDSTGLPPLKFPMATQPVPHNQRAPLPPPSGLAMMGGNDQVRPQATNDHLMAPSAYPTQPMVQSAYEPFDAVQPNSGLPLELDCQPRVTHISSRQQSLDVSRASSVSVGLQINRTERNEPHWPHNNGLPRNGNFNAVPPIVDRGTGRNGTRAARGNRRGGYNQRNATVQVTQQHQGDQRPTHNKRDGTPYSVNTFRRQTVGHQPPNPFPCRNSNSGLNGIEYLHCTCDDCNQRNRSVHVLVKGATPNQQLLDLQTRIKFGLGERFGKVDAVFPVPSKDFAMFIVRFSLEYSVSEALVAGGGDMAEIGISVTISPVVRSKWINRPHGGVAPTNGSRDLALQHPPLSSPIATNQPHSMSYLDAAGVSHAAHSTQNLGLPVHLPHVQIIRGEYSGQPYVSAGHFPHAAFARTSFSNPTYHAGQHLPSREQAQNQGRRMSSSHRETSFGSRASLLKKVEVPQPKASKGKENGGGKEQAKGSAQAKECKPSKAKHTMSSKTTETSSNETGSCCADQIVLGDGKVNDRQLEAANNAPPEESLPTLAADSIPGVHREDHNSPSRVPSIFTDQEIKERRKAWARISMPIGPRKVKTCPTSANDIMETKESASKSALDGKSIIASERSLPSQSSIFMPDTGSTPELSPNRGSAASSLTQKGISFSGRLCDETTAKTLQSKPTKGPSVMHSKHKQGTSGRESRQSDRSGQDSSFSTPTSPHLHMAATKPSELHRGHQARSGSDQPQPGEGPRKSRKNKNKKKAKQGEHSQQASTTPSNPAMAQAGRSKESPQQPGTPSQGVQNTAKAVSKETCSQKTISEVRPLSPGKRYREDSTQRCGSTSPKRTKPDGDEDSSVKGSRPPTPNDPHQTQVINEETRGRKGYRVGAGGSLRMGKQRRARPLLTEPSVAEQHLNTQVAPPSSDFGFECPSMAQLQGSTCMTGDTEKEKPAAPRVQSQLNPAAKDYQSPSWDLDYKPPTKAENNTAFDNAKEVSLPQPQKADNARQESPAESTPTEDKKEPTLLNDAAPTDSASPGTRKPSKSPKLDKGKSKGKGKGKGKTAPDEDKTVVAKNMKAPVEDKAAPTEDKATPTKKKAEEPHTPNRASAQRKANLDNDHWPSLPPPRDRAASKSSTPSLWGAKKTGGSSRQSSPGNK